MNKAKLFFSVIIIAHNEEKYIVDALRSLERQSFTTQGYEIIVINNASTDQTKAIVGRFAKRHTQLRIAQIDQNRKGVNIARNSGAEAAAGKFFVFLDADNTVEPAFLEDLHNLIITEHLVCGNFRTKSLEQDARIDAVYTLMEWVKRWGRQKFGKCFCRSDIFFKVGRFNESLTIGTNLDFATRMLKYARGHSNNYRALGLTISASSRRFYNDGYGKTLGKWFLAYLGFRRLRYN